MNVGRCNDETKILSKRTKIRLIGIVETIVLCRQKIGGKRFTSSSSSSSSSSSLSLSSFNSNFEPIVCFEQKSDLHRRLIWFSVTLIFAKSAIFKGLCRRHNFKRQTTIKSDHRLWWWWWWYLGRSKALSTHEQFFHKDMFWFWQ